MTRGNEKERANLTGEKDETAYELMREREQKKGGFNTHTLYPIG